MLLVQGRISEISEAKTNGKGLAFCFVYPGFSNMRVILLKIVITNTVPVLLHRLHPSQSHNFSKEQELLVALTERASNSTWLAGMTAFVQSPPSFWISSAGQPRGTKVKRTSLTKSFSLPGPAGSHLVRTADEGCTTAQGLAEKRVKFATLNYDGSKVKFDRSPLK